MNPGRSKAVDARTTPDLVTRWVRCWALHLEEHSRRDAGDCDGRLLEMERLMMVYDGRKCDEGILAA